MTAPDWFAAVTLAGRGLRLSPLRLTDSVDLLAALGEPAVAEEVLRHLPYGPPRDRDEARRLVASALADPDRVAYAQRLAATGALVGTTSFYEISPATRSIAIGYTWLARAMWRTAVNTESKLLMLTRAFDGLGAERVVWHTDIANERSQRAIERLGAQREGVFRHHRVRRDGSWRDTVQYALLRDEWPQVSRRLAGSLGAR